ncbi:MAG: NAD-dependent epimerase/dehydratase family protein, partial [Gammaproteobacteria bacterium]|nr:NAD-dependent epimerase/dehydratase family protein [Gammaproteobacteria bacterium]
MTRPRRVLITGAGGFIGRWSVPPLLRRGFDVHAVISPDPARPVPEQLRGATLHRTDLIVPERAVELVAALAPTDLLHFAWIAKPGVYAASTDHYRWLEAGRTLLAAFLAAGGSRAVAAGSSAEYAATGAGLCVEGRSPLADAPAPSPYAECKLALQRFWESECRHAGTAAAWGRIFFQF